MSSTEDNKATTRRFYESYSTGVQAAFDTSVSTELVNHSMGDAVGHGPWLQNDLAAEAALPDQRITVHEQIAEGDKVVSRWTLQGTNTAPFMGRPATGNTLTLDAIVIDVVRDGKIVEHTIVGDLGTFMAGFGS
ncbi:ester cyclase [Geodermatophilus sp. URMC 62]|uniref:ester cyclase n=1 Tax=Geodermatophilus sp. URMC 62 TaxID=3423414 RepID=UPI00406C417D